MRDLIVAARAGSPEALNELLGRYRPYLTILARMSMRRLLQGRFDASDVVQDALVRAQRGLTEFHGASEVELLAWLRQILARTLSNANRAHLREGRDAGRERSLEQIVSASSQALSRLPAPGTSPSRGAERREAGAFVAEVLARLKDDDREVITLRSLEEREWSDVAARMGRSEEAVRALWGRAIERVGELLERPAGSP